MPRASTISSLTMSKPSQLCVFKYVSTIVNLSYPSHALISNYLATASENLSIFRSVTSSQTCVFISATIYKTSIIAGVTILHTLLLLLLSFCHKSLLTLASTHSTLPLPSSCATVPIFCHCVQTWGVFTIFERALVFLHTVYHTLWPLKPQLIDLIKFNQRNLCSEKRCNSRRRFFWHFLFSRFLLFFKKFRQEENFIIATSRSCSNSFQHIVIHRTFAQLGWHSNLIYKYIQFIHSQSRIWMSSA